MDWNCSLVLFRRSVAAVDPGRQVISVMIIYSRNMEVLYEITYGEKKDLTGLISSRGNTVDQTMSAYPTISGFATPISGARTPNVYA